VTSALSYTGPRHALDVYERTTQLQPAMYRWRSGCRLCDGALETIIRLEDTPPANELVESPRPQDMFPLALARCAACEHFQIQTVVDPSRMFGVYHYTSGTSPVFRRHLEGLAQELSGRLAPGDLVVEIGSNDGTLLKAFDGTGARVLGVDPARNLADEATASGVLTYPGFFNVQTAKAIARSTGKAKLVVALNVLAHADGLGEIADGIRELLTNDGELVLEVAYLPDMLRDGTFDMIYAEHVAFWHLEPLRRFFAAHGFNLYDAERVDSQGGSIRCFLSLHAEMPVCRAHTERLGALMNAERELVGAAAISGFCERINAAKIELGTTLRDLKAQGKRIAAFGCPAKATTLLHHFGIGRETIDYIVEENPLKVGKFSPGKHIPVVDKAYAEANRPDVMLVLAWNFAGDIHRRNSGLADRWLVPLPTPGWIERAKGEQ
jgi:SAM-dependent methyltransferase